MVKDILKLTLIGLSLFAAGFLLKSVGLVQSSANASDDVHLMFTTSDGLVLHAWENEAVADSLKTAKPKLAFLLPMMAKTHESYEPFRERLNQIGYATIAFDLRGHGMSNKLHDSTISFSDMPDDAFGRIPNDIAEFFADFRAKHPDDYDYDNVIVIGASIGANTAGILLGNMWVSRSVLLSPGADYRGLQPGNVMLDEKRALIKPIYIASSNNDTYSAESSKWLFENYAGRKVMKKYPGDAHGTDILHSVVDADSELLDWLLNLPKDK
ncbi:MAG: alpha/beta fold hydrolase [Candidatus Zixiibacteriota bacterium]